MKHKRNLLIILLSAVFLLTCETDPLTGESNFYLFSDSELFAMSFEQYEEFLLDPETVVLGSTDLKTIMVRKIGQNIKSAAEKWYASIGQPNYLKNYEWEYNVVQANVINAWCMPGGKIVFYTGIFPLFENSDTDKTTNESMLATVMGHEVAHALLNHGKQRLSWGYLQSIGGALGAALLNLVFGASEDTQNLFLIAYGIGTNLGLMLPFSRGNESEADYYGLILMAIAGYNPEESVPFWERMDKLSGSTIEFLSTHPSNETRISNLTNWIPEAKAKAAEINK